MADVLTDVGLMEEGTDIGAGGNCGWRADCCACWFRYCWWCL